MTAKKLVSLIIVNYNAGDLLDRCLESVLTQTYPAWELIIVDNASTDNSLASAAKVEQVRIIRNKTNVGFAAAQNQGIRAANGAYLMPLNFDINTTPTFLSEMVAALEADPRIGSVCGKLLQMSDQWIPTGKIDSAGMLLLPSGTPYSRGAGEFDHGQYGQQQEVFGALGAAPLYRREMLSDIAFDGQYFDERFFMWYEDVDLDWRASLRGWICHFIPTAVAYHVGHPEVRRDSFHVYTTVRNRWWMLLTNLGKNELCYCCSALIKYEISLFLYVVRIRLLLTYFTALRDALTAHNYISQKRQFVRSRAVRTLWRHTE